VVLDSVDVWRRLYSRDDLVSGMPGWYFTDWDRTDPRAAGFDLEGDRPHAVCNAWWRELLVRLGESPPSSKTFDDAFLVDRAYTLIAGDRDPHLHASAAALGSGLNSAHGEKALAFVEHEAMSHGVVRKITPYFGYFVARALARAGRDKALEFLRTYYLPIAKAHGTLFEIDGQGDSLAHGWSMAIVEFLVD
jgi:hypothetical protein